MLAWVMNLGFAASDAGVAATSVSGLDPRIGYVRRRRRPYTGFCVLPLLTGLVGLVSYVA